MSGTEQVASPAAEPEPGPGSKSAVRQYEQELEQKERAIREGIAAKIARIHEVERQLAALHNQLHVNVAPRKQALELLRHKIEEENRQIDVHRAAHSKAKAAMEAAAAALAAAEQRKAKLSEELTMLVMQSSGAQMRKLEQLSEELDHLTTGLPPAESAAVNGTSQAAASSDAARGDATVQVQVAAAAAGQQQQEDIPAKDRSAAAAAAGHASEAAVDASSEAERQAQEEARQRKLEQQRQAAVAARGRHVQLGGRRASNGSGSGNGSPAAVPTRIPQPPVARTSNSGGGSGRFEGFD